MGTYALLDGEQPRGEEGTVDSGRLGLDALMSQTKSASRSSACYSYRATKQVAQLLYY